MILPAGYEKLSDKELKKALMEVSGYDEAAADFIVRVLNGTFVKSPVM